MDNEKPIQRYMAPFLEDLEEHLHEIHRELLILMLEKEPREERWAELAKTLLLTVRSLQDAANFMDIEVIKHACHKLARIFQYGWEGLLPLNRELLSLLFTTTDRMKEAGMQLPEQQDLGDCALATLLPRLDAVIKAVDSQLSGPLTPLVVHSPTDVRRRNSSDATTPQGSRVPAVSRRPSPAPIVSSTSVAAIKCPLCNSDMQQTDQVDLDTLGMLVSYRPGRAMCHELRNHVAECLAHAELARLDRTVDTKTANRLAHISHKALAARTLISKMFSPPRTVSRTIEGVHQELSEFFRFNFRIDASRLHDQKLGLDIDGYHFFVYAILQEILVIVGRMSNPEVELRLEVQDSIVVGQAALPVEAEVVIDSLGWRLACLVGAVHHATIDFTHQRGVPVIRWAFPTTSEGV